MISTSRVNLYIHCFYLLILQNYLFEMDPINYYKYIYLLFLMMTLILCDRLVNLNEIS